MTRYEILSGFPSHGPLPTPFGAGGTYGSWSGHSEGLIVRFRPAVGEPWVANFQPGRLGWNGAVDHPNGRHLIAVAKGQGYVFDPEERRVVLLYTDPVYQIVPLPQFGIVCLCDGLGVEAVEAHGTRWKSPRISWDEIRNIRVEGPTLYGEASTPTIAGNEWSPFTLDLTTGRCEDGIYEHDMANAIPAKLFDPEQDGEFPRQSRSIH